MKVSIDGILGSARKINSQRSVTEEQSDFKSRDVKTDSLAITKKLDSRIDGIETEFKSVQTSLTKNQIIKEGLAQVAADASSGGKNTQAIIDSVKYEGAPVLKEFLGNKTAPDNITVKTDQVNAQINSDITRIRKLQVEADNIMASNLAAPSRVESLTKNVGSVLGNELPGGVDALSNLQADKVMRLIK